MSNPTNPAFTGPGTQPMEEDGSVLEYMEMPEGMMTFARPIIPEPEEAAGLDAAKAILEQVLTALRGFRVGDDAARIDLRPLDAANLAFVDQMLGSGEVSIVAGSDVLGPMGHELVPLASKADADDFMKDHKGKKLYTFDRIPAGLPYALDNGKVE